MTFITTVVAVLLIALPASAQPAAGDARSWGTDSGVLSAAGNVVAIAQDAEGYLWLGTTRGLLRFDGSQFLRWGSRGETPLPSNAIRTLVSSADGSLWVTFTDAAGVSRISQGQLTTFGKQEGLPDGLIAVVLQDRLGTVWAGGVKGLARLEGDSHWVRIGSDQGLPDGEVNGLYQDRAGNLWVGSSAGAFRKGAGRSLFEPVEPGSTYLLSFAEDRNGGVWATDTQRIVRQLNGQKQRQRLEYASTLRLPAASRRLLADSRGDVWVAAIGSLLRIREKPNGSDMVIEPVLSASNITGSIQALFEDREQNLWIGMAGGLLRLSERLVTTDLPLEGLTTEGARALAAGADDSVWVATTYGLHRFSGTTRRVYGLKQTMALHTDTAGRVWIVTTDGISRAEGDSVKTLASVRFDQVSSITTDPHDNLWLCQRIKGLSRWNATAPLQFEPVPVKVEEPCTVVFTDRSGRVWVGFGKNAVAVYDRDMVRVFTERDGLAPGSVITMLEDATGAVWVNTVSGVSRFDATRLTTMTEKNGLPGELTRWMVEDDEGFVWVGVNGGAAVVRINTSEMNEVAKNPDHQIRYVLYDDSDGLITKLGFWGRPAAVRARDGKLWFATATGVAILDPGRLPATRQPARPRIEDVVVDGRTLSLDSSLPARTSTLQIDYTALSLSAASKLRFKYMLEGFSSDWVYAGQRRQTIYTNLRPGDYRFRVAATVDGLWKEPEAIWAFTIRPAFYQTAWFYGLCITTVAALVAAYWALSLRAVRNRYAVVLAERTRVSREIHDTLLQSLGAVGLELEVVAAQLPESHPSVDALRRLRRTVVACIAETRQTIWDLRSPSLERRDLGDAVRSLAALVKPDQAQVDVVVEGRPWSCPLEVQEELLRIGREAINNAVRHGRARRIQVALEFSRDALRLRVSDDGAGFDPSGVPTTGAHCGLLNMKERAERVHGRFSVTSRPGAGTIVEAIVPVASAA